MALSAPTIRAFETHLDDFTHHGVRAEHARSLPSAGGSLLESWWTLSAAGVEMGSAMRSLHEDRAGAPYVVHEDLMIFGDKRPPGAVGIGRAILRHAIDKYRRAGFRAILIEAYGVGAYLWGTCGFEFSVGHRRATPEEGAAAARGALSRPEVEDVLQQAEPTRSQAVAAFRRRIWDGGLIEVTTFTSPRDIAGFDHPQDGRQLTKTALAATSWNGIYVL